MYILKKYLSHTENASTSIDKRDPMTDVTNDSFEPILISSRRQVPTFLLSLEKIERFLMDSGILGGFRKTKVPPRLAVVTNLYLGSNSQPLPCNY